MWRAVTTYAGGTIDVVAVGESYHVLLEKIRTWLDNNPDHVLAMRKDFNNGIDIYFERG